MESVWGAGLAVAVVGGGVLAMRPGPGPAGGPLPTTIEDFFGPGTQPETLVQGLVDAQSCQFCHADYNEAHEPFTRWAASMMGQAARDPVFYACLSVANQDAAFVGDLCLRCHTPGGWLGGRSNPPDGSALQGADFQGVSCSVCHRMVDPVYQDGVSPPEDYDILQALGVVQENPHSGQYVMDPYDRRRGPFVLEEKFPWHQWLESPFHRSPSMCATCHDVSNPVFTRQDDGTYALNTVGEPHPTHDKYDEFPLERTWSEWSQSEFAAGPIEMGGRFGGNKTAVSSCQDCHMPDTSGVACAPGFGGTFRDDLPQHNFNGANSWVLKSIRSLYDDSETFLTEESVAAAIARNVEMLSLAADLDVFDEAGQLRVRVTNFTGHKLPSGYPEGRRMWVHVAFKDADGAIIDERGHYDFDEALLTPDTKVYEAKLGLDQAMSDLTGLPAGESFHFALNNTYVLDNRIPPMGFTNSGFGAVQAAPVGYEYEDGQHWDDTVYDVPDGTATAEVTLYHQTTTREYIEFLRDENVTDGNGQLAYEQWVLHGKSEPVAMASATIDLAGCAADVNGDGVLNILDFVAFQQAWQAQSAVGDCDGNGSWNVLDFVCFQQLFVAGCE